jgi:hypothetical protein
MFVSPRIGRQLKMLESLAAKCEIKLVKALNGSNVVVRVIAPFIAANTEFQISIKSKSAMRFDLAQIAHLLWDAKHPDHRLEFQVLSANEFPPVLLLNKFKVTTWFRDCFRCVTVR